MKIPPLGTIRSKLDVERVRHGWTVTVEIRTLRAGELVPPVAVKVAWAVLSQGLLLGGADLHQALDDLPDTLKERPDGEETDDEKG
jgi:hypothetical protein